MSSTSATSRPYLFPVCLALLTVVVFINGVMTPFVFDDRMVFETGVAIRSFDNAWSSGATRRVGMLTFAANYWLHGLRPAGFHVVNIAIHAAAALALYGLTRRTLRLPGIPHWLADRADEVAVLLAAVWAIHPLQTESVTYSVQRFESLAGLFVLCCAYSFVRGATAERHGWAWQLAAVAAASLAVQTKETSFPLPLLLLAFDRVFVSVSWRVVLRKRAVWHGLFLACSAWLLFQVRWAFDPNKASSIGVGMRGISSWEYLSSQAGVILHYLRLVVCPDTLCIDYAWPVARSFWRIYPPGLVILSLLAVTVVALVRWPRVGFLGLAFFLLLAPSSSFMPIADLAFEHRMYLPLAPLIGLAACGAAWAFERWGGQSPVARRSLAAILVLVVVACGARTVLRNRDYRDPIRLWRQAVAVNPHHTRAYTWIGMVQFERGDDVEAIRSYRRALSLKPGNWMAWLNLGVVHMRRREDTLAIGCFRNCLKIRPGYAMAYQNYGSLLLRQGKTDEAIQAYRWALHFEPKNPRMWSNLGLAYLKSGDAAKSRAMYARARALDPRLPGLDQAKSDLAAQRRDTAGQGEPTPARRPRPEKSGDES